MYYRKTVTDRFIDVIIYLGLASLAFAAIAPVIHVIAASLSDPFKLDRNMGLLLRPLGFTLKGYKLVFTMPSIKTGYINSVYVVVVGTAVNMCMSCLGAYVLAVRHWGFGRFIMIMIMITMFFSGGLIPTFLLVKNLNLIDRRMALILPDAIAIWNLIILRTAFMSVPSSLFDSARIDGATDITLLVRIVLPLSKAVLAVIALFYAVGHWNAWFGAVIYLRDRTKFPLQVILREVIIIESTTVSVNEYSRTINANDLNIYKKLIKYTTIVIATVPVLCFYPFIQKYFVKGIMIGSLKG